MNDSPFPVQDPLIPRLSESSIRVYLKCGIYYLQKQILKKKRIKTYTAIGSGIHKCASADNNRKLREGIGISLEDAKDIAVAEYDRQFTDGEVVESTTEIEAGRDHTATGAECHQRIISPRVTHPRLVEIPITARFNSSGKLFEYCGIIDLAVKEGSGEVIVDLKTGRRRKSPDQAHGSNQLTGYGILYLAKEGRYPKSYRINNLCLKRSGWEYQEIQTKREIEDYEAWWQRMLAVEAAIKAGIFLPAQEGSWFCSKTYCEYWEDCKYVKTRRRYAETPDE